MSIDKMINSIVEGESPEATINEYIKKRYVGNFATRHDLSKDFGSIFSGWKVMESSPASVKYALKTPAGMFFFNCKYSDTLPSIRGKNIAQAQYGGIEVEGYWPKKLGKTLVKGIFFKKSIEGKPAGDKNYGFKLQIPIDKGATVSRSIIVGIKNIAKTIVKASKKAKRYLSTSDTKKKEQGLEIDMEKLGGRWVTGESESKD
jgi:hypothetical protein